MAVDWILNFSCPPKETLGAGDFLAGTDCLLECLKARSRAEAIAAIAQRRGESPIGKSITIRVANADGQVTDREVSYDDLVREGQQLTVHEPACSGCPANVLGRPFGCVGVINYPIRRPAEEWLMSRLQPTSTFGGHLLLAMIRDFGYTGQPLRRFRQAGLFEAKQPATRTLDNGSVVSADQVFQAIFCISEPLDPGHCLCILFWLGCIRLDGAVVQTPEQALTVNRLEGAGERAALTKLDVGEPAADQGIRAMQLLLRGLYASWLLDAPVWVSA
jgi:hypothetical protein